MNIHQRKLREAIRAGLRSDNLVGVESGVDIIADELDRAGYYGQANQSLPEAEEEIARLKKTINAYHRKLLAWEMTAHEELSITEPVDLRGAINAVRGARHD